MITRHAHNDIQGRIWGVPYDFRRLTWARVKSRVYNPDAPMFTPKAWGVGWTINLHHPGSRWLLGALGVALTAALIFG